VEKDNQAAAAGASVDHDAHQGLLDELMGRVASCFARRETRLTCRDMVHGLLAELFTDRSLSVRVVPLGL